MSLIEPKRCRKSNPNLILVIQNDKKKLKVTRQVYQSKHASKCITKNYE